MCLNTASISVRNVRNLHQLTLNNGGGDSSQMDIINRNASNSNLNYYTHPNHDDLEAYYHPEDVYGVQRQQHHQQQQQQKQMLQQQQQPRSTSLRQSQSRSGSQRNLSQLDQQEQSVRVSCTKRYFMGHKIFFNHYTRLPTLAVIILGSNRYRFLI